jgi:hypothetical protein
MTPVTEDDRRRYDDEGVVCLRRVFDDSWLDVVAQAIEQGRANFGPMYVDYASDTKPRSYETDFWIWPRNTFMCSFIFDSPAALQAGRIMGSESVMLVTDNWFVREAGAVNRAPWHHDGPYFDLDGQWCVLWMGLEPVGPGDGVVFLKGWHNGAARLCP